MIIAKHTKKWL